MTPELSLLIEQLAQTPPGPLSRRQRAGSGLLLLISISLSLLATIYGLGLRPDLVQAIATPVFLLKMILGLVCLFAGAQLLSASCRPRLAGVNLLWLWLIPLTLTGVGAIGETAPAVDPDFLPGWACTASLIGLSLPIILALLHWSRLQAPTRPAATALAIGLTAYGPATLIFALHCPYSHASFVLFWYALGLLITLIFSRMILLPRLRW